MTIQHMQKGTVITRFIFYPVGKSFVEDLLENSLIVAGESHTIQNSNDYMLLFLRL